MTPSGTVGLRVRWWARPTPWVWLPVAIDLLLNQRDALLAAALDEVLATREHQAIDIAVVYGAAHMRALTGYLAARHGFRPRTAEWITEWITVFDF